MSNRRLSFTGASNSPGGHAPGSRISSLFTSHNSINPSGHSRTPSEATVRDNSSQRDIGFRRETGLNRENKFQEENDYHLAEELDYITVTPPVDSVLEPLVQPPSDKASRLLGIRHRASMEPVAASRASIISTRSERDPVPSASTLPLCSLYTVGGLPRSVMGWSLADPDSVLGLHHTEGAVNRWWRPEVLGSTISPGAGGGKKKRRGREEILKGAGALSRQDVGKIMSKALKLSFTREVEVIASTLQPASTIHTFTFTLPAPNTSLASTNDLLRASVLSTSDHRASTTSFAYPYTDDPFVRPSSTYLGPPSALGHGYKAAAAAAEESASNTVTYHGVCLTVWSHADAERSTAIRRTLEAGRSRKESVQSAVTSRIKGLRHDINADSDPSLQAKRRAKRNSRGPWTDLDTDAETDADGVASESDFEVASTVGHGPGESTLFLPGDTVFWLPYALTLVSRHPIYDLMRDYLTLSWARFSKDVQSHTLQISKILAHPAPRAGELVRLDASPKNDANDSNSLEVIARFPGGLDFGGGLVDINFSMWPLFKCLNIDNILTICEIALAPTGRVLFFSRHPALLGIAVFTIKYLVELRGWNGIALPAVHSRDAKIYIEDPGPWILSLATEARYSLRPPPEVCVCDLDINYLSCPSPPPGVVSSKKQRDGYRQRILAAFGPHYHPDHAVPSEFKEAFPAGRFRPICKIQAKRGASSTAVAEQIQPPDWWHSTRIIQAFDSVLQDRYKKPSFFKRIGMFGAVKRPPQLTAAEQTIQLSIRKRATAFVDARDDLETKIGRLSRRLNFLMTESDLWRDKFVTFEHYAEKLSAEANQLRTKINKEQRETKRLSGLVVSTASEKTKLQNQLKETEHAHHDAMLELEKMRDTMEKMENERAEMVAEIEAQIESALASMTMGITDAASDFESRPSSRLSSISNPRSRRPSDAGSKARHMRSFGTESTLAESLDDMATHSERETGTIPEDEEEIEGEGDGEGHPKQKRFSAKVDISNGMDAVDEGINEKSEKIAQKVLEIQQKLETALTNDHRIKKWKEQTSNVPSDDDSTPYTRPRPRVNKRHRHRSGTESSTHSNGTATAPNEENGRKSKASNTAGDVTPVVSEANQSGQSTPEPQHKSLSVRSPSSRTKSRTSTRAITPGLVTGTDESDNDFQSAYSASPRESYGVSDSSEDIEDLL